jgi:hypothetical protein
MLNEKEFYIESLRDHLYYLRSIQEFCLTIELSFYKNNAEYIAISQNFADKANALGKEALSYTGGLISPEALESNIYVTEFSLPSEVLTENLFGINIDTTFTEEELKVQAGVNQNINETLINNIKRLNEKALVFAQNFKMFCNEIREKLDNNELFSFSYSDFFSYLFDEVDTYISDLERIIAMESFSPIYAVGYEYKFATTLQKTARFIRDCADVSKKEIYDIATYYVNSFGEIIDSYLKASISPDVQEKLSDITNNLLIDYQNFIKDILKRLIDKELYFITPSISIDNIYTSVNFYKFILDKEDKNVK